MKSFETFRSLLAGADGSEAGERAVATAASLAKLYRAKLTLLWVKIPPAAEKQAEGYGLEEHERTQARCEDQIRRAAEDAREQGVTVSVVEVAGDLAAGEIEKYVQEHAVDLLVVGHRDLSWFRSLLEGSTAEKLLHDLSTSILVVHAHKEAE